MAVPDYESLMLPLLELLAHTGPIRARDAYAALADRLELSQAERAVLLPSGGQAVLDNRTGWAKMYLKKAGLVGSPKRGVWEITERGRELLATRPARLNSKALRRFDEFVAFEQASRAPSPPRTEAAPVAPNVEEPAPTPDEAIEAAYEQLRAALAADLLERVQANTPEFFESLVVDLMLAMGYGGSRREAGEATQLTSDGGIDGVIREDRLGLDTIYLQAKRWRGTVSRPDVQKFAGALQGERARKGVMITTSTFSDGAKRYVERLDSKIVLIDGERLAGLMIDHGVGVALKRRYEVKVVDGDYFDPE